MAKIIGLTGGIASGKSTVSKYLTDKGLALVDADQLVHDLQLPGGKLYQVLVDQFGTDILSSDGYLNRPKLSQLIFSSPANLERSSQLQDKIIREELAKKRDELTQDNQFVFLDIPLLFEKGYQDWCDEIWLVAVDENTQIERLMSRNDYSREEALQRIASQMFQEEKLSLASLVLDNNGSMSSLYEQIEQALLRLNN